MEGPLSWIIAAEFEDMYVPRTHLPACVCVTLTAAERHAQQLVPPGASCGGRSCLPPHLPSALCHVHAARHLASQAMQSEQWFGSLPISSPGSLNRWLHLPGCVRCMYCGTVPTATLLSRCDSMVLRMLQSMGASRDTRLSFLCVSGRLYCAAANSCTLPCALCNHP